MNMELNTIWPPLLYIIPNFDALWPLNFMILSYVFVFKMHTFTTISKNKSQGHILI